MDLLHRSFDVAKWLSVQSEKSSENYLIIAPKSHTHLQIMVKKLQSFIVIHKNYMYRRRCANRVRSPTDAEK